MQAVHRGRSARGRACPPWCSGPTGGMRGRCLSCRPPSALRPGRGGEEGRRPWCPDAAPRRPRGGGVAVLALGGQLLNGGAHSSTAPHYPVRAGPSCSLSLGSPAPLAVAARRWLAGGGGEGRWLLGAAVWVSGQRLVGCGAVGPPSRSLPPPSLPREVAHAPLSRCTVGGGVGRGARLRQGRRPAALSPTHSLAPAVWAVTCVAACVGVGAVAVAGSASSSGSG